MVVILDCPWQKELMKWWSHGEDYFSLWLGEAHMAQEKMMQHLGQDSPGWFEP